jgi:hypothetical protein
MNVPTPETFPGALYDCDGTLLAGTGPEMTLELTERLPHKALIHDKPGEVEIATLHAGDRLWLLPDTFGTPPELPIGLLTELANVVRRGGRVGLAARSEGAYVLVRDALVLLLNDAGGRA